MSDTYQVYRAEPGLNNNALARCVLLFMERYNILPQEIRLHVSQKVKDLSLPDEVGSPKMSYEPNVMLNEIWIGPIPEGVPSEVSDG